jgi:hypothetical protein
MRQFEQDWLELGSRVARSLHYQARRWQRRPADGGRHEGCGCLIVALFALFLLLTMAGSLLNQALS